MNKLYLFLFWIIMLNSCFSQTDNNSTSQGKNHLLKNISATTINGIVFFSFDGGMNWVNASEGLPENISIGLGGIATSAKLLCIATKQKGVYIYNFDKKIWENIPSDEQMINANIGALAVCDSVFYVGTQHKGVFYSKDRGITWKNLNLGLSNLTIRRFCEFNNTLYVCTNDGFYSLSLPEDRWNKKFVQSGLQTNGATWFKGKFYLATNKGIFSEGPNKTWVNSSPQFTMHNISSDNEKVYAMSYSHLLQSSLDGISWQSFQSGIPNQLYTFNVYKHQNVLFAGQWNGIYKSINGITNWQISSNGLPSNFAVTNLKTFNNILVVGTSERKLKAGLTVAK